MNIEAGNSREAARALTAAALCVVCACIAYFNNTVVPTLASNRCEFSLEVMTRLPTSAASFGMDGLRLVQHARALREDRHYIGKFVTPPEAAMASPILFWLVMPLTGTSDRVAIFWIITITSMALTLAIWLGGVSGAYMCDPTPASVMIGSCMAMVMALLCFGSYGYFFAVERGNWHGMEVFCSMGACATLMVRPRWVVMQAFLLAMAVHMKIYPLVLVPMFLLAHRRRFLVWFMGWYVAGLFSWGTGHFVAYVTKVREFVGRASGGPWAHDATTWSLWMAQNYTWPLAIISPLAKAVPTILWAVALYMAYRVRSKKSLMLLYASSVMVMSVMQTLSWDYKLVIVFPALAAVCTLLFYEYMIHGRLMDLLLLVTIILVTGLLTRNPSFPSALMVKNKFPLLVILQGIFLLKHVHMLSVPKHICVA